MERNLFGISAVIASLALLIWSIGETFAYPQGPNLSMGSNPVFSYGGDVGSTSVNLMTVPANQTAIVTDVVFTIVGHSSNVANPCRAYINMSDSSGNSLARFRITSLDDNSYSFTPTLVSQSFLSGLPISSGDDLILSGSGGCDYSYTVSGYYSHQ